jgi:hypothetical protein
MKTSDPAEINTVHHGHDQPIEAATEDRHALVFRARVGAGQERHDDPEDEGTEQHAEVSDVLGRREPAHLALVDTYELECRDAEASEHAQGERIDEVRHALEERGADRRDVDPVPKVCFASSRRNENDGPQRFSGQPGKCEHGERRVVVQPDQKSDTPHDLRRDVGRRRLVDARNPLQHGAQGRVDRQKDVDETEHRRGQHHRAGPSCGDEHGPHDGEKHDAHQHPEDEHPTDDVRSVFRTDGHLLDEVGVDSEPESGEEHRGKALREPEVTLPNGPEVRRNTQLHDERHRPGDEQRETHLKPVAKRQRGLVGSHGICCGSTRGGTRDRTILGHRPLRRREALLCVKRLLDANSRAR